MRSDWIAPTWGSLDKSAKLLRGQYHQHNTHRLNSITAIETITDALNGYDVSDEEKLYIALGAWFSAYDEIAIEYEKYKIDPEYKSTWIASGIKSIFKLFNKSLGSTLFPFLKQALNILDGSQPDDMFKFVCYQKLYDFLEHNDDLIGLSVNPNEIILSEEEDKLINSDLDVMAFKKDIANSIRRLLGKMGLLIEQLANALPVEESMEMKISQSEREYQLKKEQQKAPINMKREFYAQLIPAISFVSNQLEDVLDQDHENTSETNISPSQLVKMGILVFVARLIKDEYWVRSPLNSVQYSQICKILNVKSIDDIDEEVQFISLFALQDFVSRNLSKIELYGQNEFKGKNLLVNKFKAVKDANPDLLAFRLNLNHLINELGVTAKQNNWPAATLLGSIGGVLAGPWGYGFGHVVADYVDTTITSTGPKVELANLVNLLGKTLVHKKLGGCFGFLVANNTINHGLQRLFGKAFEYWAGLTGSIVLGALGGLVIDLSYKGLVALCNSIGNYEKTISDPLIMKRINPAFLTSLLEVAREFIPSENLERIKYASGNNPSLFFKSGSDNSLNKEDDCFILFGDKVEDSKNDNLFEINEPYELNDKSDKDDSLNYF